MRAPTAKSQRRKIKQDEAEGTQRPFLLSEEMVGWTTRKIGKIKHFSHKQQKYLKPIDSIDLIQKHIVRNCFQSFWRNLVGFSSNRRRRSPPRNAAAKASSVMQRSGLPCHGAGPPRRRRIGGSTCGCLGRRLGKRGRSWYEMEEVSDLVIW